MVCEGQLKLYFEMFLLFEKLVDFYPCQGSGLDAIIVRVVDGHVRISDEYVRGLIFWLLRLIILSLSNGNQKKFQ